MKNRYQKIADYLAFIEQEYQVQVCVKDYSGFVPVNKELDEVLQPYLAHTNAYCMYVKSDRHIYHKCLTMIRKMSIRCKKEGGTFFGMCHAGLCEYVTPIVSGDIIIGTINVGFFGGHEALAENRIHHTCRASEILSEETALRLYHQHVHPASLSPHTLIPSMELIAEYLSLTYDSIKATHDVSMRRRSSNEDTILSHAAEYVRQNFTGHISVAELADFCHCSESHLSHIFKKRIHVNINAYINKVRVEASKNFLVDSPSSIADIALNVGFYDPNYYSRVFSQLVGISPTEYRRRFRH